MSEFQVGDVVRVKSVNEECESSPEFDAILHNLIGQTGTVAVVGYQDKSVIIHVDGNGVTYSVLMFSDEIELVHRPAPKEQLQLLEGAS